MITGVNTARKHIFGILSARWGAGFRTTYGSRNSGRCSSNYLFQQKNRVIAVFLYLSFGSLLFQICQQGFVLSIQIGHALTDVIAKSFKLFFLLVPLFLNGLL